MFKTKHNLKTTKEWNLDCLFEMEIQVFLERIIKLSASILSDPKFDMNTVNHFFEHDYHNRGTVSIRLITQQH